MLSALLRRACPAVLVVAEYAANGIYGLAHPSLLRSGATPSERHQRLPGDDLVAQPNWQATRAETIHAPAATVWPWLVQLGYGRGGYYGDLPWWHGEQGRGPAASADHIVPELQRLEVGEVLLDGANCDATHGAWTVRSTGSGRSLVMQRAMLAGIKRRAEQAVNQQAAAPAGAITGAGTQRGRSRR